MNSRSLVSCKEGRYAMKEYRNLLEAPVMRTIRLPEPLWYAAKAHGERTGQAMRIVLEEAAQAIPQITQALREIGIRGEYADAPKAIRAPLSRAVLEAMRVGHEQTGLPQIQMLALALYRLAAAPTDDAKPVRRSGRKSRGPSRK